MGVELISLDLILNENNLISWLVFRTDIVLVIILAQLYKKKL